MKKQSIVMILTVLCLSLVINGCSPANKPEDNKIVSDLQVSVLNAKNEIVKLQADNIEIMEKVNSLMENKNKKPGDNTVTAGLLNIRQSPNTDNEPIGQIALNSIVNIVDTSDPMWYKAVISLSDMNAKEINDKLTKFTGTNGNIIIDKKYLTKDNKLNMSYVYLRGRYIDAIGDKETTVLPQNPTKPFVYGLIFYDEHIADLLAKKIWSSLKDDLIKHNYDGIQVVSLKRDKYIEDVKKGKYDAVESAPTDFAFANKDEKYLEAFGKTVNKKDNSTSYAGIVIVRKGSGITSFSDLKSKKIYSCSANSGSGYKYQKYFLNKAYNIDIDKDCAVIPEFQHNEVMLRVAKGEVDVGFCGDFVITDDPYKFESYAKKMNLKITNKEELNKIKENILVLPIDDQNKIPNNPHAIKAELYSDEYFVEGLYNCVKDAYDNHREDFGLTKATSEEYEVLLEMDV